jgi:hypothetical protein
MREHGAEGFDKTRLAVKVHGVAFRVILLPVYSHRTAASALGDIRWLSPLKRFFDFTHTRRCGGGPKYKLAKGEQPAAHVRRIGSEFRRNALVLERCHLRLRDGQVVMPDVGAHLRATDGEAGWRTSGGAKG